MQYGVAVRNARLSAVESTVGTSPLLKVFSGAVPANCAASDPSGLLVTMTLPSDWMNSPSGGTSSMAGSWTDVASGAGTAQSWRIYDNSGAVCGIQGDVISDLVLDNNSIAVSQVVTVTSFVLTAGNP